MHDNAMESLERPAEGAKFYSGEANDLLNYYAHLNNPIKGSL